MKTEIGNRGCENIQAAWVEFMVDSTWEKARDLKDAVQKAMIGKEPVTAAVGGIVGLAADGAFHNREKFDALAQAIAGQIEVVRRLFRNHEERINAMQETRRLDKKERKDLERKVEKLQSNQDDLIVESIERKFVVKPQPAEQHFLRQHKPVARCKNEKGVEQDLIPGVSVVKTELLPEALYLGFDGWFLLYAPGKRNRWACRPEAATWLFDLDFPSFAKPQDMKGGTP